MRRGFLGAVLSGALVTAPTFGLAALAPPAVADPGATITVNVDFSWNGTRPCQSPRAGSVTCVAAQADVEGLGLVEYSRDAVPSGQTTPDGCPEYSTQGTIWVAGGTARFDGAPVPTCGGDDFPDAHYAYTIHDGAGVLAGATGTGDVVADNGVDRWRGTIHLAAATAAESPGSAASPSPVASSSPVAAAVSSAAHHHGSSSGGIIAGVVAGVVVLGAAMGFVARHRGRRTPQT